MQPLAESALGGALRNGWRRLFYAMRPDPRSRKGNRVAATTPAAAIDPVALTIMAVDRLGPARLRAVFYGVPVIVKAPDPETADIFRAALSQMAKERPTDRLISVELTAEVQRTASAAAGERSGPVP